MAIQTLLAFLEMKYIHIIFPFMNKRLERTLSKVYHVESVHIFLECTSVIYTHNKRKEEDLIT